MPNLKPNRLRLVRKRLGHEQKQIANLLGHKTIQQISRYESGHRIPSLKTALKLSIVYRLPVRVLFLTYYERCRDELSKRAKSLSIQSMLHFDLTEPIDHCSYLELLNSPFMDEVEKEKIRRHTKQLMEERKEKILNH